MEGIRRKEGGGKGIGRVEKYVRKGISEEKEDRKKQIKGGKREWKEEKKEKKRNGNKRGMGGGKGRKGVDRTGEEGKCKVCI